MCGIFCLLSLSGARCELDKTICKSLQRRGPDSSRDVAVMGPNSSYWCLFSAHLLHMRGLFTPQPVQDDAGNILMWNGEIFGGLPVMPEENDTDVTCRRLSTCKTPSEVLSVLSAIQGPWGLVYYQRAEDFLWFGRDFFGRRSLLWKFEAEILTLTSVAAQASDESNWKEIPAVGVFRVDLKETARSGSMSFEVFPWTYTGSCRTSLCSQNLQESVPSGCSAVINQAGLVLNSPVCPLNVSLPNPVLRTETRSDSGLSVEDLLRSREKPVEVDRLIDVLSEAVKRRVQPRPYRPEDDPPSNDSANVAVLFSGGIDSMILAALADRHIPAHQLIDLLNVAFRLQEPEQQKKTTEKPAKDKNKSSDSMTDWAQTFNHFNVPDRLTGRAGLKELQELNPERRWRFVEINVTQEELQTMRQERICHLVHPLETVLDDSIGCAVWFAARGAGVEGQRPFSSSAKVIQTLRAFYLM